MRPQQTSSTLPQWCQWLLKLVVVVAIGAIWWRLGEPVEYVFDERYHVPAARAVLKADWRIFDWWQPPMEKDGTYADWLHPPVFKYLQAGSILIFGDGPWAWRFPSAVAATISLWIVWQLSLILIDKKLAGWPGVFWGLSGLFLVQARTGMNDMVATCLSLIAVLFYAKTSWQVNRQKQNLGLTGLFLGLTLATKWSGLWLWGGICLLEIWKFWQIWQNRKTSRSTLTKINWLNAQLLLPLKIVSLIILPIIIYLISYWPVFVSGRGWEHLINLHQNIWQYHLHRDKLHPDQSNPLQWVLNLQPVHYWQASVTPEKTLARITTLENPAISLGLVVSLGWLIRQRLIKRNLSTSKILARLNWMSWLFLTIWLPNFFSPRILFQYHFLPALPLAIILAVQVGSDLPKFWRYLAWWLVLSFGVWLIFYCNWTGLPVSFWLVKKVYWLLPSWR